MRIFFKDFRSFVEFKMTHFDLNKTFIRVRLIIILSYYQTEVVSKLIVSVSIRDIVHS